MPDHAEQAPQPRRLGPPDVAAYIALRRRMLADEPWAFAGSPDRDVALDPEAVANWLRDPENAILAAPDPDRTNPDRLIASAGIRREEYGKLRHRALIWGVFVEPDFRAQGLGARVVQAAIDIARNWSTPEDPIKLVYLSVSEKTPGAQRLYERLGFKAWGTEPDATYWNGQTAAETHLHLNLTNDH
ncbi:MAG: GNAT family N-acetyltransferase [Planctomycetota bacterium]